MPPKLPSMKPTELIKILEHFGFERFRTQGSHWVFINKKTSRQTVVPVHNKDIPKGTFFEILKQSGISREDIFKYLN